ncbi:AbrB/MazE/SpoVT family DNA-binding domain-containing protein [Cyanobium sp. FGCU-52]|nr:AbrB/MazE/SpoVT family DNA-binding domain-containing protein [Cyanobium sp. FGCU52]
MTSLTVTRKGQITLGKELLAHPGLQPGQQVDVLPGGRIQIRAARTQGTIDTFLGFLAGRTRRTTSQEELEAAAAEGWAGCC